MLLHILIITVIINASSIALAAGPILMEKAIAMGFGENIFFSSFTRVGDKLYFLSKIKRSWYNAFLDCRDMGGVLASIENASEMALLSNYLVYNRGSHHSFWLSASDVHSEGNFSWYGTGKLMIFADWHSGQPDNFEGIEHCVHLTYEEQKYKMNDLQCKKLADYICETKKPDTIVATLF